MLRKGHHCKQSITPLDTGSLRSLEMFSEIGAGDSGKEGIENDQEQRQKDTFYCVRPGFLKGCAKTAGGQGTDFALF